MPGTVNGVGEADKNDGSHEQSNGVGENAANTRKLSKKFKIESVAVADDPLYHRQDDSVPNVSGPVNVAGEKDSFQSVEELPKPRTASMLSNNDQRFYSLDELNAGDNFQKDLLPDPSAAKHSDNISASYSKSADKARLRFDDSFYKKALVVERDDQMTDISVPVPDKLILTPHETLTSTYEQNMSINKLLRERHKTSLAAMGRLFGSRQRQLEEKERENILPTQQEKPKKRCNITGTHVCLTVTFVVLLSAAIFAVVAIPHMEELQAAEKGFIFHFDTRVLDVYLYGTNNASAVKANVGQHIGGGLPYNCTYSDKEHDHECYRWGQSTTLNLSAVDHHNHESRCVDVVWHTSHYETRLSDCISLSKGHWFGGFYTEGSWPLGKADISAGPYLPGKKFGSITERLWVSSNGSAVLVKDEIPLEVSVSGGKLCLSSWYGYGKGERYLNYTLCTSKTVEAVVKSVMKEYIVKENSSLPVDQFHNPIFNVYMNKQVTESLINKSGLSYSYIHNSEVNILERPVASDFPNGNTSVSLFPYISVSNPIFFDDADSSMWLRSPDMTVPALFKPKTTASALLNTSNALTYQFIQTSLPSNDVLIEAYGDVTNLMINRDFYSVDEITNTINPMVVNFLSTLKSITDKPVMSTMTAGSQSLDIICKFQPMVNLTETVAQVLLGSLMGYQIINPGEIGGFNVSSTHFIRSVQLALFMPVMQFSEHVWNVTNGDQKIMDVWKNLMNVRNAIFESHIKKEIEANNNVPVYKPVWWENPNNESIEAFGVMDQFIIGDLMIVPIVNTAEEKTERRVYFPTGYWSQTDLGMEESKSNEIKQKPIVLGPTFQSFTADLSDILAFQRLTIQNG